MLEFSLMVTYTVPIPY